MSNTEFVMAPLELLKRVAIGYPQAEVLALGRSAAIVELGEFLCRATTQHQGEPVTLPGRRTNFDYKQLGDDGYIAAKEWNACLDEIAKLGPLYTHADPAEVGEIKKHNAELLGEVDTLTADVERLRAENQSLRKTLPNSTTELVDLRAQLAETHALLRMVYLDEGTTDEKCARVEQIISASAERNQCDGCQAGIPVVNGAHRMGKPGGYSDSMACQAAKYASAEPTITCTGDDITEGRDLLGKCLGRIIEQQVMSEIERDDATLIDTLRTCEKWFVKHSPTAPLIGGFGEAEHPMLTCIRAALERKP